MAVIFCAGAAGRAWAQTPAARPRALLLQQAESGGHHLSLFALKEAGFETTWINKDRIAEVPTTADDFRNRFDVVFFGSLALEGGVGKLLSAPQLAALKQFVAEGGGLVTVIAEAAQPFSDLLPLTPGKSAPPMVFRPVVSAADHPALAGLPSEWPVFGSKWNSFSLCALKPGAQALLEVPERYAGKACPFLATWSFGKGRVLCMNSLWAFSTGAEFQRWGWSPVVLAQWGRWAAGLPPLPREKVKPIADPLWFWRYELDDIPGASEALNRPVLTPVASPPPECVQIRLGDLLETAVRPIPAPPQVQESGDALAVRFGNGIIARLDKRGMVGYRTEDGLILAKDPVEETPHILHSGAGEAVITNAAGGEFAVLKEALPEPGALRQSLRYLRHAPVGDGIRVTFELLVSEKPEGELEWTLTPRAMSVEGVEWRGVGESFALTSPRLFVEHILPRHRWAIGGQVDGHFTWRTGCYSQPRGYNLVRFSDRASQDAGHFNWFCSGQPFQMLGSPAGTLWCYAESPAMISSWLSNQAGSGFISMVNKIAVGRRRGRIQTPTLWYLFARAPMTRNLWMASYDFLRDKYRKDFGIRPMHPRPTAMMRFNAVHVLELRRFADVLLPLAKRLGFKRLDCGINYVHDTFNPEHGGVGALKYLCDRAHEAGLEVFFYCGAAWAKKDFPPLKEHPEWIVRGRDGKPRPTGYPDLFALSLRSGWWDYSLAKYKELKEKTGMDGVWLDSWTMPNEYINFAEPDARPTVEEGFRYIKALQDLGYTALVEGQCPVALDSFWYRSDRYADLRGNEFCLFNTTPWTCEGDGLFTLDLFRLLSYNCAMFQDPRLLSRPEDPLTQAATHCNHLMNELHAAVGFPLRVRETPLGASWECERGYVLFAHQSRRFDLSLPQGTYTLRAVDTPAPQISSGADGRTHVLGVLLGRGVLIVESPNAAP